MRAFFQTDSKHKPIGEVCLMLTRAEQRVSDRSNTPYRPAVIIS